MVILLKIIAWATLGADLLLLFVCFLLARLLERRPGGATPLEAEPPSANRDAVRKAEQEERDAWRILQGYDARTAYGEAGDGA